MKQKSFPLRRFFTPTGVCLFLLILHYTLFLVLPMLIAFVGSFHDWNPLRGTFSFTGFSHYQRLLTNELFWSSLRNTLVFSFVVIAARMILGLVIASALFSGLTRAKNFFRAAFYMPVVTPLVAVSFVWLWLYNPQFGLVNQILGTQINWLYSKSLALPAVMTMTAWKDYGYAVVLYLAGLYTLPKDCYEAARMDGASSWVQFKKITLPLLKPMSLFIFITSLIAYLQAYIQILVMTNGGPGTSTYLSSYLIYDEAFMKYKFGYASAISFAMFLLIGLLTLLSFRVNQRGENA
ncbi:MAG: sugar ABC transporter permease [Spirochaetales bacterium]|nr:sugar ABC transporter permease [Spirochaetales bacterium]